MAQMYALFEGKMSQTIESSIIAWKMEKSRLDLNPKYSHGILFPKNFWPTVRKILFEGSRKLLKFDAEGREFAKFLRSLEQSIRTVQFLKQNTIFAHLLNTY